MKDFIVYYLEKYYKKLNKAQLFKLSFILIIMLYYKVPQKADSIITKINSIDTLKVLIIKDHENIKEMKDDMVTKDLFCKTNKNQMKLIDSVVNMKFYLFNEYYNKMTINDINKIIKSINLNQLLLNNRNGAIGIVNSK